MSTYTQIIYQIVFSTKYREPVFTKDKKEELLKYISGVIKNKNCHLYQINVVDDHLHIVTHIHPTISLSSLVKDIKVSSSIYIKEKKHFAKN
ncbi:MAG: IS200/IS605 family transposase [Alphaproteobacteria bacterium]|nr:IS200/IS605 family transposase [Alphaproteobacteria bacterium]